MTTYQGRMLFGFGAVVWVVSVLFVIACLVAPSFVGAAGCELGSGTSVFGEPSRSWLPPGTTCTYDLSSYGLPTAVITEPSPLRLVVVAAALIGLPALLRLRRLLTGRAPAGS